MTDLFTPTDTNAIDETKDYLVELVGEGKKFSDVSALAKGKATSDAYIQNLEAEMAELRGELRTRATIEDAIEKMRTQREPEHNRHTNSDEPDGKFNPEDINKLVEQHLAQATQAQREASNFDLVTQELQRTYGADYQRHLNQKLTELGLDKGVATNLARTQPKAFLKLFGEASANAPAPALRGAVNTGSFQPNGNVRGAKYYDAVRKEMGSAKFFSDTKVQKQRWADIQSLGVDKFKNS